VITKITAGVYESFRADPTNRLVVPALMELMLAMFVAGVQVREKMHQLWIVDVMDDVYRATGWASAREMSKGLHKLYGMAAPEPYGREGPIVIRDNDDTRYVRVTALRFATGIIDLPEGALIAQA